MAAASRASRNRPTDVRLSISRSVVLARGSTSRIAAIARSLLDFDSRPWLSQITSPALVVAGAADTITPPRAARELADALLNAQLHIIPRAGHWLIKTHTAALLDLVMPWLDRCTEGAA